MYYAILLIGVHKPSGLI